MQLALQEARDLMAEACRAASVPGDQTDFVIDHYLAGELRGKPSHGLAKFCFESQFFAHRQGPPRIVRERGALAIVDAQREIGPISARFAATAATHRARQFGAGIIGMINTQRYGILGQWSEQIAAAGFIGLVMNTSRAESTVHGARTPALGVNPLSIAVPTNGEPFVADMSTTLAPMGTLWEARRSGDRLPPDCFVDDHGAFTDDPATAASAVVFGEHRGFVISVLVQLLTGSLFGFPMSSDVDSTWRTGYTFIALDPSLGGEFTEFTASNTRLIDALRTMTTADGTAARLPGQASRDRAARTQRAGTLTVPDALYERLVARASGDFNHL
ncbi:Ldh family oxidoreductase [Streptomyces sp. NPDC001185]|uniref:Ldh family oxidoreductase n=1 Tax=Streptomyces sp. NPDC001185 TaxID=3154380 RepID=UPI003321E38F